MTLFSEVSGDPTTRPPVVLIHGFGGSAAAWDPVVALLPEELPVIAYDLPGHNRSLHTEERGGAGKMAKAILADLDAQGFTAFHLAGHSMGGAVGALIAMRAGAKVLSLTLVAPGGMGPEINAHALERFAQAATADELADVMRMMTAPGFDLPAEVLDSMAMDRERPGAIEALEEIYDAMFTEQSSPVRAQGVLPIELLETLKTKVAVIWGEADAILPSHQMDRLPEHFTKIRVPGMGHMLLDECPARIATLIVEQAG
ncbi:MAG TPA: alpha/beta fold hydrolase [Ensifer sp.]|nr:alpha/beta fold hydrolase [Ensifer sp.]